VGYVSGDYLNGFAGTSAAAPIVSGVIALMLEANPLLGYRDVQDILALSARKNDPSDAGWQDNGAGLHFNHDFGFGLVDATAAVRLAETWTLQQTYTNLAPTSPNISVENASFGAGEAMFTIDVTEDILIEHVIINLDFTTASAEDIVIMLTSPDGTQSVLMDGIRSSDALNIDFDFSSVAHWGESSVGQWRLSIFDSAFLGSDPLSTLSDWSLRFIGDHQSVDDLYVYTSERIPSVIDDSDGGVDTVNFAALSDNIVVDLSQQTGHSIGAQALTFSGSTQIEEIISGDGNDILSGSSSDNFIRGGRGDDRLIYDVSLNAGNEDVFDGDKGADILQINFTMSEFVSSAWIALNDFLSFLTQNDDSNSINGDAFSFSNYGLTVSDFESLEVFVDDVIQTSIPTAPTNTAPVANDDSFVGDQDVDVVGNVLADNGNGADSDPDGDALSVVAGTYATAQGGSVVLSPNGDFTYTPNAGFFGADSFDYTLSDGDLNDTGTVFLTINEDTSGTNIINGTEGVDDLSGTDNDDVINGLGANDTLRSSLGADHHDGGNGWDSVQYNTSPGAVTINLATGIHNGAHAIGDSFANIEGIFGSAQGDIFIGDSSGNFFNGWNGDDTFYASGGVDLFIGGNGADTYIFEAAQAFDGVDRIRGFSETAGDVIDISDVISGYDPLADALSDYVQITDDGTHGYVEVDSDGAANGVNFTRIAQLDWTIGLDANALEASGNLKTEIV